MKDYTPPPIETRLERAGRFRWWLIVKSDYYTHKKLTYGPRYIAERKLEKMRYEHRHSQLLKELE